MINKSFYVYILRCKDRTYYTGWTVDLEKRFKLHSQGKGSKYTRGRTPLELVYSQSLRSKSEAMKREVEIKKLSREEKEVLVNNYCGKE